MTKSNIERARTIARKTFSEIYFESQHNYERAEDKLTKAICSEVAKAVPNNLRERYLKLQEYLRYCANIHPTGKGQASDFSNMIREELRGRYLTEALCIIEELFAARTPLPQSLDIAATDNMKSAQDWVLELSKQATGYTCMPSVAWVEKIQQDALRAKTPNIAKVVKMADELYRTITSLNCQLDSVWAKTADIMSVTKDQDAAEEACSAYDAFKNGEWAVTDIKPEHLAEAEQLSQMYFNPRDMRDGIAAAFQRLSAAKEAERCAWYMKSHANHMEFIRRANLKGKLTSESEIQAFLVLAQVGEAGELANCYKKLWRGDEIADKKINDEIADVYIYLKHLCWHRGVDIDQLAAAKVAEVTDRLAAASHPPAVKGDAV